MMGDFDLQQALDCSPENEPSLFDKEETCSLDLQLEVSCNRRTMKCVANLVLAVNRMNKVLACCGSDLSEDKVCSAIMDCVIEEIIVKTERMDITSERKVTFKRSDSVREFVLRDTFHKDFTLSSGGMKLQAITLRATECRDLRVKFEMFRYCPTHDDDDDDGLTILLSVGQDLHISCFMSADKPELHLERCSLENLKEICENENRFLFTKRVQELSLATFESVKYPGWFISTSCDGTNETVEMCQKKTDGRSQCFRIMPNN